MGISWIIFSSIYGRWPVALRTKSVRCVMCEHGMPRATVHCGITVGKWQAGLSLVRETDITGRDRVFWVKRHPMRPALTPELLTPEPGNHRKTSLSKSIHDMSILQ